MQHEELRQCRTAFMKFYDRYTSFFREHRQREHLRSYLLGLLGPLERKSIEPIALEQDVDVRLLQHFIGASGWDDARLLVEHRRHVCETLGSAHGVLILDPTSFPKRGEHSVGVARQWCGQLGKEENCVVGVNLTYASEKGHTFLDRRLYLPQEWISNLARRRACGVPDDVAFRTSGQLAYEMIQTARRERIPHTWITGDEEFGKLPWLGDWLTAQGEQYIFEVPVSTRVWLTLPKRRIRGPEGYSARLAKLRAGKPRLVRVDKIVQEIPPRAWRIVTIRDASKGPIQVQAVAVRVRFHRGMKKARPEGWLVISETLDQRRQRKFFHSNAPRDCSLVAMLSAAYSRWPIEQEHGQGKNETGLGDYETRTWSGWHHHTALSFLAHHFLVIQRNRLGEKISRDDRRRGSTGRERRLSEQRAAQPVRAKDGVPTTAQPPGAHRTLETGARRSCAACRARPRRRATSPRHHNSHLN